MATKNYHFFEPIKLLHVQQAFPHWQSQFAEEAYENWLSNWAHDAYLLYHSQFLTHTGTSRNTFLRINHLSDDVYLDSVDEQKWEEFRLESGLAQHAQQYELQSRILKRLLMGGSELMDFKTIIAKCTASYQPPELNPTSRLVEFAIMRVWFNSQIHNSIDVQNKLRQMPYADYLMSSHWKHARSAMILAHGARCQGDGCNGGEAYWRDEASLQVHHVTYVNRGNERFEDLRLLCEQCHQRHHSLNSQVLTQDDQDWYQAIVKMQYS